MMKKNLKIFLSFFVLSFLVISTGFAQNYPEAFVSADRESVLLSDGPLVEKYEVNLSPNLPQQDMQDLATHVNEQSVLFTVEADIPNARLIVTLDLDAPLASNWGFEEWKKHLLNRK